jgi:hypothetical protein
VPRASIRRQRKMFERMLRLPAEVAGETIVRGVERRRSRVVVGQDAKIAAVFERLLPSSYWPWLDRMSRPQRATR